MRNIAAFLSVVLVVVQTLPTAAQVPAPAVRAATPGQTVIGGAVSTPGGGAGIAGTVVTPEGEPLGDTLVRARNLLTNEIGGSTVTSEAGEFAFLNLPAGSWVLEIVDDAGQIIGTSSFIATTAGIIVPFVTITATTGALSAVTAATGLAAALGATAARGIASAAAASGVAGVMVPQDRPTASPSR